MFTIVFNKVKKYAVVYKDIKFKLDKKEVESIEEVVFNEREQLDIAEMINPGVKSFIHYYHNFSIPVYQYPALHWNKTDLLVAYDYSNRKYVVFKMFWPNATEYTVEAGGEFIPAPTLYVDEQTDGILDPGTEVPDMSTEPGKPEVIFQSQFNNIV